MIVIFINIFLFLFLLIAGGLFIKFLWSRVFGESKRKERIALEKRKENLDSLIEQNEIADEDLFLVKETLVAEKKLNQTETKIQKMEKN